MMFSRRIETRFLLLLAFGAALASSPALWAQESGTFGGVQSLGVTTSFSNTSSHMFIGEAERRRVWTVGVNYSHLLHASRLYRFDYEASILPVYEETDPAVVGTTFTFQGLKFYTEQPPARVVFVPKGPVGFTTVSRGVSVPVYAVMSQEKTYAALISPFGARLSGFPRSRVQPTFALDLGFVVSRRAIPVDDASRFNYMFALGPGVQVFGSTHTSWRLELLYRHTSNAGQADENPGVDQAVISATFSLHH
ncbi:MAG TPA: acyloxyacyl hydrolase [Acidobacteriaceae bacterium]|nr:acyloxyacyl hydrolase [Acidobacteriaceae bacterium]